MLQGDPQTPCWPGLPWNPPRVISWSGFPNFREIEYDIATATTDEEIKQQGKAGFDKYDEANGIHYFRRVPKNNRC